jgi:enoyl-CoA hydratase/carnithine racemase
MTDAARDILVEHRDGMAIITLNRPAALNAMTFEMIAEFNRAAAAAVAAPEIRAIVITGAGRGFCSGLDAASLAQASASGDRQLVARGIEEDMPAQFASLTKIGKPVIAAVNGVAAGIGLVLALMCDLRFVAEEASFVTAFSRRGLVAEHGTSWLLPRIVGPSRALDLLMSSRKVGAEEAYRIGLADRIAPGAELMDTVAAYVADIAANVSPRSMAMIKDMVWRHLSEPMGPAVREADRLATASLGHPDTREGVQAFVERRPPRFLPWTGGEN